MQKKIHRKGINLSWLKREHGIASPMYVETGEARGKKRRGKKRFRSRSDDPGDRSLSGKWLGKTANPREKKKKKKEEGSIEIRCRWGRENENLHRIFTEKELANRQRVVTWKDKEGER